MTKALLSTFAASCSLFLLASSLGCAPPDEATEAASTDLTGADGLVLRGQDSAHELRVRVGFELHHGTLPAAALKRVTVERAGASFRASCTTAGRVERGLRVGRLACTKHTSPLDPHESLRFTVVEQNGAFFMRDVQLSGTRLAAEHAMIAGAEPLDVEAQSSERRANPFAVVREANAALEPLVGRDVYVAATGAIAPAVAFDYLLDEYISVSGRVETASSSGNFAFDMLEKRFDASSPFVASVELARRALAGLPQPPRCKDGVLPATPGQAVKNALSPLGGPAFGLAKEVSVADVPAAARAVLELEGQGIAGVTFKGSDYKASVFGYYAIFASCMDPTIVAYAVWGGGSGEPDYHDGTVIGVDLTGAIVSDESESG